MKAPPSEGATMMDGPELEQQPPAMERRIVSVVITPGPGPLPGAVFDQAPRVIATLDDGRDVELFSFYAHERSYGARQFVGLTVEEARRLKFAPENRLDMRRRAPRHLP
jgi:hypothetical protein